MITQTPRTDDFILHMVRTDHNWRNFARLLELENIALRSAAQAHLANPYPHDLLAIRSEVARGYESEEDAAADLDAYCTEEAALAVRQAWREARDNLEKILNNTP